MVGIGIVAAASPPPAAPAAPLTTPVVSPLGSQSSSWYCVGTGSSADTGQPGIVVTNPTGQELRGSVTVSGNQGSPKGEALSVPAHATVVVDPSRLQQGHWLAARVDLSGGGATVSQVMQGANGWAESPCQTSVSPAWYFASGATTGGSQVLTSVYNPTSTTAVVNLSFVTTGGIEQPPPYQGLVVAPGTLVTEPVGTYVQNQAAVATEVTAKSGRVVAGELLVTKTANTSGLALPQGSPRAASRWVIPSTTNPPGGAADLSVLDPSAAPARVTVRVRLPAGPVAPFTVELEPGSVWQLPLGTQTRLPQSVAYVTTVTAQGGQVVVGRSLEAPPSASGAGWGAVQAVAPSAVPPATTRWYLPSPGAPAGPTIAGARVEAIQIANPGSAPASVSIQALFARGLVAVPHGSGLTVGPGRMLTFLPSAGQPVPYAVSSGSPVVVTEDLAPVGAAGVVTVPAVPSSATS